MAWEFRSLQNLRLVAAALVLARFVLLDATVNEQCSYTIVTVTGCDEGAATDSNISVRLENRYGKQVTFPLQNGQNDFERGQVDTFLVSGDCVPNICKTVLYTDDTGFFPRWYVETIKVNERTFPMQSWLPRDDGVGFGKKSSAVERRSKDRALNIFLRSSILRI